MNHKLRYTIIAVLVIGVSYYGYNKLNPAVTPTMYVVSTAQKGTIIKTVSGTGQISSTNQVDIKAKASGDVVQILAQNGQAVKAGQAIAYLDAQDAIKAVRDAQVNLDSAKLALEKLTNPADQLSMLQAQNAVAAAQENKDKASSDLDKSYEDAFNSISNTFLNIPAIVTNLYDNLYGFKIGETERSVGSTQSNEAALVNTVNLPDDITNMMALQRKADADYVLAKQKYDKNFEDFKNTSRLSDQVSIDNLLNETTEALKVISESAKSQGNMFDAWIDIRNRNNYTIFNQVNTTRTQLSSDITQINSLLSTLTALQNTIQNDKLTIADSDRSVAEKSQSLADLQAGAQPIDIESEKLSVQQRQNSLLDAQEKLADYSIRAPFDGILAKINIQKGDNVSAGFAAASLITTQQTVEISLNEVDISKVKIGQKVNLTFDAIPDLNITGVVADVDAVGTVAQGVVTYNVKISLDTQDDRVKSGMSVAASIITDIKQDVVMVPNSAIKSSGQNQYVEIPTEVVASSSLDINSGVLLKNPVKKQSVQIGISDDSFTEIISGLNENDNFVARTIASSTTKTTTATAGTSLLQQVGGRAATGGGAVRNFGGAGGR